MVSAARLAATNASISTPVEAVVAALEQILTPFSHTSVLTSTKDRGSGWHIGINSAVRLAAVMPANRAISSGLPLGFLGNAFNTLADISTNAEASASRCVAALAETSTIVARPPAS